jgi:hypothetical protein
MDQLCWERLFALDLDIAFDRAQMIGAMPLGWRGIYLVNGGSFEGPGLRGRVLPGAPTGSSGAATAPP